MLKLTLYIEPHIPKKDRERIERDRERDELREAIMNYAVPFIMHYAKKYMSVDDAAPADAAGAPDGGYHDNAAAEDFVQGQRVVVRAFLAATGDALEESRIPIGGGEAMGTVHSVVGEHVFVRGDGRDILWKCLPSDVGAF
jgi:hypothetical protein